MDAVVQKCESPAALAVPFDRLGLAHQTYAHPPVFTVQEGLDFKHVMPGGHTKNLFLKDKKGELWLVTALQDTVIDLKWLPKRLSAGRLSFGSAPLLLEVLGVTPGSVTPLALLNDAKRCAKRCVRPVFDARLMACELVNCHPLRNDMTTALTPAALMAFARDLGYDPLIVDFAQ